MGQMSRAHDGPDGEPDARALFLGPLSGCVGTEALPAPEDGEGIHPLGCDRPDLRRFGRLQQVTVNGTFAVGESSSVFVQVDTITAADGGAGLTGDATVHLGLWLPVIDGRDWSASNLTEACRVPVIADVGPYYEDGDVSATTPADRLGRFLIENYVPSWLRGGPGLRLRDRTVESLHASHGNR